MGTAGSRRISLSFPRWVSSFQPFFDAELPYNAGHLISISLFRSIHPDRTNSFLSDISCSYLWRATFLVSAGLELDFGAYGRALALGLQIALIAAALALFAALFDSLLGHVVSRAPFGKGLVTVSRLWVVASLFALIAVKSVGGIEWVTNVVANLAAWGCD